MHPDAPFAGSLTGTQHNKPARESLVSLLKQEPATSERRPRHMLYLESSDSV